MYIVNKLLVFFSRGALFDELAKVRPRRELRDFNPHSVVDGEKPGKQKVKHTSTRKFFGPNEDVFIMDAKSIGNIYSL